MKRYAGIAARLSVFLAAVCFLHPATAVETREVVYRDGGAPGYLALPQGGAAAPGVILIHEWWGLNDDIRARAREFAAAGYAALAVDMYDGESATTAQGARTLAGRARKDMEGSFANLRAAFDYMRTLPRVDGARLASVGWCFGGGWSYQIARNNFGARASVIYYGRFNPADDLAQMRSKIIGHFAEKDRVIKVDDVRQFQARLKTASGDHEIYIYPNTGHGFANNVSGYGKRYNAQAAATAHERTLAFLKEHL